MAASHGTAESGGCQRTLSAGPRARPLRSERRCRAGAPALRRTEESTTAIGGDGERSLAVMRTASIHLVLMVALCSLAETTSPQNSKGTERKPSESSVAFTD